MNQRYRVFRRRWGTYYVEDLTTGKQESLKTKDKAEAYRLAAALNETIWLLPSAVTLPESIGSGQANLAGCHGADPQVEGKGHEIPMDDSDQGQGL